MKTALITGASSGIGLEFAKLFAVDKTNLVLVARNEKRLNELAEDLKSAFGIKVSIVAQDLSQPQAAHEVIRAVKKLDLEIDFLVNNAGFGSFGPFAESDMKKESEMMQVNIVALTELTRLFVPSMVRRKTGHVLNVASTAAFVPGPYMAVYYATKAYVLSFSEAIATELKSAGVKVSVLCPGPTKSGFQVVAGMGNSKLVYGRQLPTSREVAQAGYRAMLRGETVIIPGIQNKILSEVSRFFPRAAVRTVMEKIQQERVSK